MSTELRSLPASGSALQKSSNPELRRIRIHESEGAVVLRGTVSSYYLKQLAQESVKSIADGRRIVNLLEVAR